MGIINRSKGPRSRNVTMNLRKRNITVTIEGYIWPMRARAIGRAISFSTVAVLLFQCGGHAWASGPGTTAADVLNIPVGARAIGMGEAYTAQADDVSSLYW